MAEIKIVEQKDIEGGWQFEVAVEEQGSSISCSVEAEKAYWEKLAGGQQEPAELVRRSFAFLLAREPKESILREFNLRQIADYFPEYEKEIKKQTP